MFFYQRNQRSKEKNLNFSFILFQPLLKKSFKQTVQYPGKLQFFSCFSSLCHTIVYYQHLSLIQNPFNQCRYTSLIILLLIILYTILTLFRVQHRTSISHPLIDLYMTQTRTSCLVLSFFRLLYQLYNTITLYYNILCTVMFYILLCIHTTFCFVLDQFSIHPIKTDLIALCILIFHIK